jgi:hypothetical protein
MLCARAPLAASMRTPNAIIHEKDFVIGLPPRLSGRSFAVAGSGQFISIFRSARDRAGDK